MQNDPKHKLHHGHILTKIISLLVRRGCKRICKESVRSQSICKLQQANSCERQKNADIDSRFLMKKVQFAFNLIWLPT